MFIVNLENIEFSMSKAKVFYIYILNIVNRTRLSTNRRSIVITFSVPLSSSEKEIKRLKEKT